MRVGLLSMQRVVNFGSFWQAYCLKQMIQRISDNQVEFIDIIPGELETRTIYKKNFSFSKIKRIPYYVFQNKKKRIFADFQRNQLNCPEEMNYDCAYDAIIIGSDEVFNFAQESPWGFSAQLFGDIKNDSVSTYAACFGNTSIELIKQTKKEEAIIKGLNNLKNISVRDQNSAEIIKQLIGKEPEINLDPVVVGNLPLPQQTIKEDKYILVYSYDFRLSDQDIISQVKALAKKNGLRILSVGFYQDWVDKNILPNPVELLKYFNNAEYVVTDTFHGTVFSLRTHKKFVSIVRKSNENKLGDLLNRIGMNDRRFFGDNSLEEIICPDIDYNKFESLRTIEQRRSINYLKACLGK